MDSPVTRRSPKPGDLIKFVDDPARYKNKPEFYYGRLEAWPGMIGIVVSGAAVGELSMPAIPLKLTGPKVGFRNARFFEYHAPLQDVEPLDYPVKGRSVRCTEAKHRPRPQYGYRIYGKEYIPCAACGAIGIRTLGSAPRRWIR